MARLAVGLSIVATLREVVVANQHGGAPPRGLGAVPHSELFIGRFGRMFRSLPPFEPSEALIDRLAGEMREPDEPGGGGEDEASPFDNPAIPAGYTYVGP